VAEKAEKKTVRLVHANGGVVSVPSEKADRLLGSAGWMSEADAKKAAANTSK
jgi:hypothetical protein